MRKGLLASIAALTAGAGLALAQPPGRIPGGQPLEPLPAANTPPPPGAPLGLMPYENPAMPPGALGNLYGPPPGQDLGPGPNSESGYASFETLLWFIHSMPSNFPLITGGTTITEGASPDLGTTTLFGGQNLAFNPFVGARFTWGRWFPRNPEWGFEWSTFITETRVDRFTLGVGDQVLARPFIDATTGTPGAFIIASPGFARGGVTAFATSQLWGMEWNFQRKLYTDGQKSVNFLIGARYADLTERLAVQSQTFFDPAATTFFYGLTLTGPNRVDVEDRFDTRNQFFVAQVGLQGEWRYRRWVVQYAAKLGMGDVRETAEVNGLSRLVLTPGSAPNEVPGGLYALSSNIGKAHDDKFVFLPEGKIQVGYRMWRNVDLAMGYNVLYFSRVIRPTDQIDAQLNPAFIPTSAFYGFTAPPVKPQLIFNQTTFWAQGLNFSLCVHY